MFGSSKETDDGEDGQAFFKPVKNPRRPRDAGPETADDDKPSSSSPGSGAKGGGDDKGGADGGGGGEGADGKPGRRRRADDADSKTGVGGGSAAWMTSPEKRTSTLVIEQDEAEDARGRKKHFEDNEDIMVIPDLDEDGGDTDQRVAHAPRNVHRKIPSLADLENEVKQAVASIEEGYDLAILLRTLVPPALVQEKDEAWTFESLLREVTDDLTLTPKTVVSATISTSKDKDKDKDKEKEAKTKKSSKK